LVASLPPPKPQPGTLILAKKGASPRSNLPAGFKDYQANGFAIGYPGAWQAGQPQPGASIYLVPQGGAIQGQRGVELLFGGMLDYYVPQSGAAAASLEGTTKEFIAPLQKGDPNLRAGSPERAQLGGKPALLAKLNTKTSSREQPEQVVYLYTVAREAGLWYLVLAAPPSRLGEFDPLFKQMIETVQFPN